MEHAEHIAEAVSYTKDTFLQIDGIITWIKLFLAIIIPLISGFGLATLILQFLVKPALVSILVGPNLGFTEAGIAYMLQYLAVVIGIIFVFLFPYYQGYLCRSMKTREITKAEDFSGLFFSGWKINTLIIYYLLPLIAIFLLYALLFTSLNGALDTIFTGEMAWLETVMDYALLILYIIVEFATFIFIALFGCIGLVHLARTGSFKEAVKFKKISALIKRIGWYDYILCIVIVTLILLTVAVFFVGLAGIFDFAVAANIIFFGLMIVVMIPTGVFVTRYLANIYETAFLEPEDDIEEFDDF